MQDKKIVYKNNFFAVSEDSLGENKFYRINSKDTVIVISEFKNRLIMINGRRWGSLPNSFEFPGGIIDDGESPQEAARREFKEETGIELVSLRKIGSFYPFPAISSMQTFIFEGVADLSSLGMQSLEEGENWKVVKLEKSIFADLVMESKITDSQTIAAFFIYENR